MVPVHVVAGFLGAGKTTTLLELLKSRSERVAVVVNDFGEAAIDPSLVREENGLSVAEIQGACVCCTAPDQLAASVIRLLETVRPERILVEPTGLARPADLVDTLRRGPVAARVEVRNVVVVLDPRVFDPADPLHREQAEAADVAVLNRLDLASEADIARAEASLATLYPPPRVVRATFGRVPADILDAAGASRPHDHDHDHASTEGWQARSGRWTDVFSLDRLSGGLAASGVDRMKGFFRTDLGSWLVEIAGGTLHTRPSPHRGDSVADVIARDPAAVDRAWSAIEAAKGVATVTGGVEVAVGEGRRVFSRDDLGSLPDQVSDVSAVVPGRSGAGVRLSALFAEMSVTGGDAVVVAGDGMVTPPIPVAVLSAAILVHSLDGAPLPDKQGGPFRLLHPEGSHGNVKGVVRIVVRPHRP